MSLILTNCLELRWSCDDCLQTCDCAVQVEDASDHSWELHSHHTEKAVYEFKQTGEIQIYKLLTGQHIVFHETDNLIVSVVLLDWQVAWDDDGGHSGAGGGDQEEAGRAAGARRDQRDRRPGQVRVWSFVMCEGYNLAVALLLNISMLMLKIKLLLKLVIIRFAEQHSIVFITAKGKANTAC